MKLTKKWLKENYACKYGINWFEKQDKRLSLKKLAYKAIEDGRGDDCFWVMRKIIKDKISFVKIAVFAAELVIDIFEEKYPNDDRPRKAIEAAKKYIDDPSEENRVSADSAAHAAYTAAASDAASDAASAAYAAYTAYTAAHAAYTASAAAGAAADTAANAATHTASTAGMENKRKEIQKQIVDYAIQFVK